MKIIVIDNYDSFVYNLCDYMGRIREVDIEVYRNDDISVEELYQKKPDGIVISPGPGTPADAGISIDVFKNADENIPVLGVCLGHQSLAEAFGGNIVRAQRLLHGKTSLIYHNKEGIFEGIDDGFVATRYHSLIVDKDSLPDLLEITAETKENEIMGIKHKKYPLIGVQFHPESILTESGMKIMENFLNML